ncbi:unnamed protein product [Natator depressus]
MAHIISDDHVVFPIVKMARWTAEAGGPMYIYTFTLCPGSLSSRKRMGVPHGSEVPYLFGTLASMVGANHMHGGQGQAEPQGDAVLGGVRPEQEPHRGGKQWALYNATEKIVFRIGMELPQVEGTSLTQLCGFLTPLVPEYQRLKAQPKGTSSRGDRT